MPLLNRMQIPLLFYCLIYFFRNIISLKIDNGYLLIYPSIQNPAIL
jgi:hypothetical protein